MVIHYISCIPNPTEDFNQKRFRGVLFLLNCVSWVLVAALLSKYNYVIDCLHLLLLWKGVAFASI